MVRRVQVDEIISEVSKTGTGGHAFVPKAWIGNKVKVTLLD
jgi:putative transposon-encoded protein